MCACSPAYPSRFRCCSDVTTNSIGDCMCAGYADSATGELRYGSARCGPVPRREHAGVSVIDGTSRPKRPRPAAGAADTVKATWGDGAENESEGA